MTNFLLTTQAGSRNQGQKEMFITELEFLGSSLSFGAWAGGTRESSSRSSDGNSSPRDEGGSASQVPQATVELAGYRSPKRNDNFLLLVLVWEPATVQPASQQVTQAP